MRNIYICVVSKEFYVSKSYMFTNHFTVYLFTVNDVIGEAGSLRVSERLKLTEEWVKQCEEYKMTLMVQVGAACLKDVQEMVCDC